MRVSTTRQGDEGQSLVVQEERCRATATGRGAGVHHVITDEYSGRTTRRPGFQKLQALVQDRAIDTVIVYKLDRAFRSVPDFFEFVRLCDEQDVAFISATEDLSTGGATGKLLRCVLAALAEFYSDLLSERMKDAMGARARAGQYCGGTPPWGYRHRSGGGGIEPDPDKAPLVAEMFRLYLKDNHTTTSITKELRARGHRNVNKSTVSIVLHNPAYLGKQLWGGKIWPAAHKPLVNEKTFQRVQDKLKRAGEFRTTPRICVKATYNYLLDGIVFCGRCGSRMTTSAGTGRAKTYPYYRCVKSAKLDNCDLRMVNAVELERVVIEQIIKLALDPEAVRQVTSKASRRDIAAVRNLRAQIKLHAGELDAAEKRVSALMDMAGRGMVQQANQAEWNAELSRWTSARDVCRVRHQAAIDEIAALEKLKEISNDLPAILAAVAGCLRNPDSVARRSAVRSLVDRVEIFPDRLKLFLRGRSAPAPVVCHKVGQWLPGVDSNHDQKDQNLLCYHCTTG